MPQERNSSYFVTAFIAYVIECCSSLNLSTEELTNITREQAPGSILIDLAKLDVSAEARYKILGSLMLFCNLHQGLINCWYINNPRHWSTKGSITIVCHYGEDRTFQRLYDFIMPGFLKPLKYLFLERWVHDDDYLNTRIIIFFMLTSLIEIVFDDSQDTKYYRFILDFDRPGSPTFPPYTNEAIANSFRNFYERTNCFDMLAETETMLSIELDSKHLSDFLQLPSSQMFLCSIPS